MRFLYFLMLATMLNVSVLQAQNANKDYKVEIEQQVVDSLLWIDFYIQKLQGPDFPLAASNFSIFITPQYLDGSNAFIVDSAKGPWDFSVDVNHYWNMSAGGRSNFVNINVNSRTDVSTTPTTMVTAQKQRIGRIAVPITDHSGFNTSTWRTLPIEHHNWARERIKGDCYFQDPAPNFPLCNVPDQPSINGGEPIVICEGETTILETNSNLEHIWYQNGTEIQGQNGSTLAISQPGVYTVAVKQYSCISALSNPASVQVTSLPSQPQITEQNGVLSTAATGNIQWYLDGQPISGATSDQFYPTESGEYTIGVSNACGEVLSDPYDWQATPLDVQDQVVSATSFTIYPNPYVGHTTFSYVLNKAANVRLEVYDLAGKLIYSLVDNQEQLPGEYTFDFGAQKHGHASGTYTVVFSVDGQAVSSKIIEIR